MSAVSIERRELPNHEQCLELLADLPAMHEAARAAALSALLRSCLPGMRERAIAIASATLSDSEIVCYLRKDADDMLRNAGLEILKRRGRQGLSLSLDLLDDPDADIVLQAVMAIDCCLAPTALAHLRRALSHPEPNVVQSVIEAIGRIGDQRVVEDLLPFLKADTWLQLAAVNALGDLRSPAALEHLIPLMGQSLIGPVASEAVARIGGSRAYLALATLWLEGVHDGSDRGVPLPLLAHVAEGLHEDFDQPAGLREALASMLTSKNEEDRSAAAACLLALGSGEGDLRSIGVLARAEAESLGLPRCLRGRADLTSYLVILGGLPRSWSFLISSKNEAAMSTRDLRYALREAPEKHYVGVVAELLENSADPELADTVFRLFRQLQPALRGHLAPAVWQHRNAIEDLLEKCNDLSDDEEIVLKAMLGKGVHEVIEDLTHFAPEKRIEVVPQLASRTDVLLGLPWLNWLQENLEDTSNLLSDVFLRNHEPGLFPVLRAALGMNAHPALIRAAGDVGDQESTGLIVEMLEHASPLVRAIAADTLGWLGGQRARLALKQWAEQAPPREAEVALRALIRCSTTEDMVFFRNAATNSEPGIRRIVAEALANDPTKENLAILVVLAADRDTVVARRALRSMQAVEALS